MRTVYQDAQGSLVLTLCKSLRFVRGFPVISMAMQTIVTSLPLRLWSGDQTTMSKEMLAHSQSETDKLTLKSSSLLRRWSHYVHLLKIWLVFSDNFKWLSRTMSRYSIWHFLHVKHNWPCCKTLLGTNNWIGGRMQKCALLIIHLITCRHGTVHVPLVAACLCKKLKEYCGWQLIQIIFVLYGTPNPLKAITFRVSRIPCPVMV